MLGFIEVINLSLLSLRNLINLAVLEPISYFGVLLCEVGVVGDHDDCLAFVVHFL